MDENRDEDEKRKGNNLTDKVIDKVFSLDKKRIYLAIIVILGLILRIIAARNITVSADDMHFTIHAIDFLKSGKLVTYDQSSSLWFYVTDIFYRIFGINQIGSRMAAILFGTLSIIIMFYLTREFFDEKIGLIAALLLAISPFHIKNTIAEMDVMAMFFVLFAMLVFVKGLKMEKNKYLVFAGILIGLGILTKVYIILFIPVALAFALYDNKKKCGNYFDKRIKRKLLLFLVIAFIFAIPSLTHNYLLYKDKGFTDLIYTNALGIGKETSTQYYSWDTGFGDKADFRGFFLGNSKHNGYAKTPTSIVALGNVYFADPIVFILGGIGLIICFFRNKKYFIYSVSVLIFVFFYMASRILMSKHYIFLLLTLVPAAALAFSILDDKIKGIIKKFRLRYLIIALMIFTFIFIGLAARTTLSHFYTQSEIGQVIGYKDHIPEQSLVVADSRIYRGAIHWMFYGRNYIESSYLPQILDASQKSSSQKVLVDVYFLECVLDDCGWGTVKDQPDFNKSSEQIVDFFKNGSQKEKEFYSAFGQKRYFPLVSDKETHFFTLYRTRMNLDPGIFAALKQTKVWFLYPIGYDESIAPIFDKYETHTSFGYLLDKFAHLIIYIAIIFAFLAMLIALYLILQE
ncbi:glycosyltransferase family 39 protein [Candidatus Pacearchaeota archaeon]|nr:glycosyltransferase family 39 protein [Candidatus Pacearchaeota archaeon]